MDLSKFLPNMRPDADVELTPEELEAEAKSERIKFHREHVRNGPRALNFITVGQQRRQAIRRAQAQSRKQNARFRRDWMANQRRIAALRGQLVTIGAVPGVNEGRAFTPAQVRNAEVGLLAAQGHSAPWRASTAERGDAISKGRALYFDILAEQAKAVKA